MFIGILNIIKNFFLMAGSYSNTVFPEPLDINEEDIIIKKMCDGDTDARNKLIEHNLRLVAHICKKYESKLLDSDDLISIGTIGLIKAIDSYNLDKSTRITTYAARCIENEILMYFRSNKKNNNVISLNDSIGYDKDGNEINLIDVIPDKSPEISDILHNKDNINDLKIYLKDLSSREKEIIIKRYGLFNQKEQTQKKIAKEMKISRSYVSRIEKRALTKILRSFMKNNSTL
ncbi:MAG: RNA polymerase sporulation sigma factor SigK [Bacilli bacterium]|nr:RNA polymerase sporulation sigma factor SigK [Bacilli bacterium]